MFKRLLTLCVLSALFFTAVGEGGLRLSAGTEYDNLVRLFKEFREFIKPKMKEGVSDYSPAAMKAQKDELEMYKKRLAQIDRAGWTVSQQADYYVARAEMSGLEFDHRVMRPWARDPGFYVVFRQFQPVMFGTLNVPSLPIPTDKVLEFREKLRAIPRVFEQAKKNLTDPVADLARLAIKFKERENERLKRLAENLAKHHPELVQDVEKAREAVAAYQSWLRKEMPRMSPQTGVGVDNYNWFVKNVWLLPYTWEELVTISQRELERAVSMMKLEEHRNRNLPPHKILKDKDEYVNWYNESLKYLRRFLITENIMTVPEWMKVRLIENFRPSQVRDYFRNIQVRDPLPLQPHDFVGHAPDMYRMAKDPRPFRGGPYPPYHLEGIRLEGLATGSEEILMHTGLLDKRPRSRELTYNLLAFRAARALADLKIHSNEFRFQDAFDYVVEMTPYGWVPKDPENSPTLWGDLDLYIRQPCYGVSYLIGSVQIQKLMADRARQLGDKFMLKEFFDDFIAAGIIPISLIRWEMTGLDDEIKKLQ